MLKISKVISLLWKSFPPCKINWDEKIDFSVSPYYTLLFSRKENIKFPEIALVAVHCNCLISCIMITWGCRPWNTTNNYGRYLLACQKWQLNHWSKMKNFLKVIKKCTRTADCRPASVLKPWIPFIPYLSVTISTGKF